MSFKSNIVRHNVRHWPPKDNLEIGLTLEWYFVVDFEVVFWFYLCLYFLFSITWIIWSRYSKTLIHKVHLTSLLVHINHLTMINLKVMNIRYPLIRNPRTGSTQPVNPSWIIDVISMFMLSFRSWTESRRRAIWPWSTPSRTHSTRST